MNTILKTSILTAALISLSASSFAQTGLASGWSGEAGLSGSKTSGNTDTTDIGLALSLDKEADIWTHKFDASYDLGTVDGDDTKNRTYLGYQLDRAINDRMYVYGNANYFKDDFGAYEDGYFLGAGLGYDVLITEPTLWSVEAGLGYRNQTTASFTDAAMVVIPSVSEGEAALRLGSDFDYAFNAAVSLYNDTEVIYSDSDTYAWNDIGISAQLAGNLQAKFGVRVDHHTEVPFGVEQTDTITRGTLVYKIN